MSMRDKLAAIIEEMFVDGPYATAGAVIDALPEMISHLSEMLTERDAALAREAGLRAALHLGVQLVEQDYLESAAGWDSFYSCAVDALGNHPTDERIDRAGTCETCSKPIYEGDQYAPCTDGAMLCFNHAPLYSDLQKQYAQCVADDIGDGDCVDAEEMVENLAIITRRIAKHGDEKVLYVA